MARKFDTSHRIASCRVAGDDRPAGDSREAFCGDLRRVFLRPSCAYLPSSRFIVCDHPDDFYQKRNGGLLVDCEFLSKFIVFCGYNLLYSYNKMDHTKFDKIIEIIENFLIKRKKLWDDLTITNIIIEY